MKKKFYFIRQMAKFDTNDVLYVVYVGTSVNEFSKYCQVREISKDCGYYFEPVSTISDQALDNLHKSVFKGLPKWKISFRSQSVSISKLYKMIEEDSFAKNEANMASSLDLQYFYFKHNPEWREAHSSYVLRREFANSTRKNLSQSKRDDLVSALIGAGLFLVLYLIECYLNGMGI